MSSSDGNGNHVSIDDGDASDEDNYPKQRPILNRHFFNKLFPKKNASRENPVDYKSVDGELSDDDCNNGDEHHSSPESPTTSIDEVPNEDQDNEYDNVTLDHSVGKCLEHDSENEEIHDSRISLLNTRYDGLEEGEGDEEYFDSDASKGLNLSKDSKEYEDSRISKTDFGAQDVTEANENEDNMNLDDENEDNMNLDDGDDNLFLNVVGGTSTQHVINQHDTSHHIQTAPQVTTQHVPSTRYGATQTQPVQSEVNGHISQEDIGTTDHDDMDYRDEGQTDNDDPLMPNKGRTIEAETLSSPLQQDVDYLPGEFLIQELEKGAPTQRLGWEVVGKDKTATRFYPLQVLDNTRQAEWDLRSNWANVKFNREINCEALLRYTLPQIHDSFMTFGLQWLLGGNKPFSWEYVRDFYRHMRVPETFPADDPWFYTEIEGTPVYVDKYTISSCTDMPLDHTVDLIDSLNEEVMTMIASELFEQPCYVSNQGIPVSKLGYRMKLIFKIAQRNVCGVRQSYINGPALYWAYKFLKTESLNVPMYILKRMMSRNFSPKESPYPCLIHQILVMKGFRDFGSNSTCVAEDYGLTTVWKQKHFKSHYVGNIKRVVDERCQMLEILPPTIPSIARRVLADAGEYQKLGDTEKAFVVQKPATRDGIGLHETIEGTSSTSSITLQVALADMQTALIAHMTGIQDAILHQVTTTQKELTKRLDKLEDQVTNLQMLVDPPCDEDDQSEEQKADRVQEVLRPAKRHRIDTTVT